MSKALKRLKMPSVLSHRSVNMLLVVNCTTTFQRTWQTIALGRCKPTGILEPMKAYQMLWTLWSLHGPCSKILEEKKNMLFDESVPHATLHTYLSLFFPLMLQILVLI